MPSHIRSFRNLLSRFRRNRGGSTVVEFALVAPMFFALLFAIIETALMFFASQVLETAVQDSARLIMTGQAQTASYTQAQFKTAVCSRITTMFDCAGGIYIDMSTIAPDDSRAVAAEFVRAGSVMLDGPLSGSPVTVKAGQASIMNRSS